MASSSSSSALSDAEIRETLLRNVKKEVKQVMEEAVTRKFVHEESSVVTSLCGAVELCLQHCLRKRALGLFKNSTTTALFQKLSKTFEPAGSLVKVIDEMEKNIENSRKSQGGVISSQTLRKFNSKYLWIRVALFEKQLAKIIDHLVQNNSRYYEKEALLSDPVQGAILASLLVGPCALEYTRMKTPDHYWTDPPADELLQRHRIHSSGNYHIPAHADSPKRPGLQVHRNASSSVEECPRSLSLTVKDYVESLHQNSRSTLLYGKNNVMIQPKEDIEPLAGYLSLHHGSDGLTVKWTPNQLMNGGGCEDEDAMFDRRPIYAKYANSGTRIFLRRSTRKHMYWDYAITVSLDEIVYLHCHQQPDSGSTLVLVGQDGVQRPPIHFPRGGHLIAFLSCLENGLLPNGQSLDPPLWSHHRTGHKGKAFPRLKQKIGGAAGALSSLLSSVSEDLQHLTSSNNHASVTPPAAAAGISHDDEGGIGQLMEEEDETMDYVFRIVTKFKPENIPDEVFDPMARMKSFGDSLSSFWQTSSSSSTTKKDLKEDDLNAFEVTSNASEIDDDVMHHHHHHHHQQQQQQRNNDEVIVINGEHRTAVRQLCDTMKSQILSRAFYGWLSHCRHLKTVRTHLSGLVNALVISSDEPINASGGLTTQMWRQFTACDKVENELEIHRLIYYGACQPEIRNEVWPYLLGHYKFDSTSEERVALDILMRQRYEQTVSEWLAVEAIIRQQEKEMPNASGAAAAAAGAMATKQDSHDAGGGVGVMMFVRKDSSLSNDVFESVDGGAGTEAEKAVCLHPETLLEETYPISSDEKTMTSSSQMQEINASRVAVGPNVVDDGKGTSGLSPDEGLGSDRAGGSSSDSKRSDSYDTEPALAPTSAAAAFPSSFSSSAGRSIVVTNPSVDFPAGNENGTHDTWNDRRHSSEEKEDECRLSAVTAIDERGELSRSRDSLICPSSPISNSSNGGIYSSEMLDSVALNIHRIDKDVHRCDRNHSYFTQQKNLDKLRNIMCTYVWENIDVGYIQGMCDLVAPLLVILDDESKTYSCFTELMKQMSSNFPHGGAMDQHFGNMRSLIQILDPELFEHMKQNGDYTHFYFCYRWFLLDFKRELLYEDVFIVWETIWSAKQISSGHFVLFIALALVEFYRDIIIDNNMDFTDIIKFFNEMAERHNRKEVLQIARGLVHRLQDLIENK